MIFAFGSIVLTEFPFTDLSASKRRPALVISQDSPSRPDIIVAFITSVPRIDDFALDIEPTAVNGLKVPSQVRLDKLATLKKEIIVGKIGKLDQIILEKAAPIFWHVFGFTHPAHSG